MVVSDLGRVNTNRSEGLDDQSEVEEAEKDDVEFFEAGEDAAEAFESAEEPLDLVAFAVHGFVVAARARRRLRSGWNDRDKAEVQSQLESLLSS